MPHWLIKSAIHRGLSWLPRRQRWNEFFQEHWTHSLGMDAARFELKVGQCRAHLDNLFRLKPACRERFTAIELGCGWYPIVPVGFFLCGADLVWALDIEPMLRGARVRAVLEHFLAYDQRGALRPLLPWVREERVARLRAALAEPDHREPADRLGPLNIRVKIGDARRLGLPAASIDLFASIAVLEYIPPAVLAELLAEFRRLATPGAVMSHWIDMIDQFSYFDRRLTPFNYLRYTSRAWHWLDSPLIPQNRLRLSDYCRLGAAAGFETRGEPCATGTAADLERVPLAPEFRHYHRDDLLVVRAWLVSRVTGAPAPD